MCENKKNNRRLATKDQSNNIPIMINTFSSVQHWLRLLIAPLLLLLLVGCGQPLPLQVRLSDNATLEKGQPVYVGDIEAGEVLNITEEGGDRVANLIIKDSEAKLLLKVGSYHIPSNGAVHIKTDLVASGAEKLPHGSRIPASSSLSVLVQKYSQTSTLLVVGGALAAIVILWLIFKSLVHTVGMILCGILSTILTQRISIYAVPYVEKMLSLLPKTAAAAPFPSVPPSSAPELALTETIGLDVTNQVISKVEGSIEEIANTTPSPTVISWCLVFIILFIVLNVILGKAANAWAPRKKK